MLVWSDMHTLLSIVSVSHICLKKRAGRIYEKLAYDMQSGDKNALIGECALYVL